MKSEENFLSGDVGDVILKEWYENGQIKSVSSWSDQPDIEWYENGQKKLEYHYKNGKLLSAESWKINGDKCPETNLKTEMEFWLFMKRMGRRATKKTTRTAS